MIKKIEQAVSAFILHCQFEKRLSPKTIKAYQIDLSQFTQFLLLHGNCIEIKEVTKEHIRAYIQSLYHWKPKTIKRKIACSKALFNFLEFDDLIDVNPFRKIKVRIKEPRVLPTVMNIPEVKNMLLQAYKSKAEGMNGTSYMLDEKLRDLAVIELLFATGIRVSELVGLKEDHLDFRSGLVKVKGKGDKERIIQVCNKEVLLCLEEYYHAFKEKIRNAGGYFFINRLNKPLSDQSVRFMVKRYAQKAGINKRITPHVFRHSFATLLLEEDVDIKYIQHMLGHSSIMVTQIYTHVNKEKQRAILAERHPRKNFQMAG